MQESFCGHVENVEILLSHGANINYSDKDTYTALLAAASNGYHELVAALLDRGAKIDSVTESGASAMMLACIGRHTETLRILFSYDRFEPVEEGRCRAIRNNAERILKAFFQGVITDGCLAFNSLLAQAASDWNEHCNRTATACSRQNNRPHHADTCLLVGLRRRRGVASRTRCTGRCKGQKRSHSLAY